MTENQKTQIMKLQAVGNGCRIISNMPGVTESTPDVPKPTDQEMQNEYNYFLAEQLTKKLLSEELISADEYEKIMEKNRRTFSPFILKIIP